MQQVVQYQFKKWFSEQNIFIIIIFAFLLFFFCCEFFFFVSTKASCGRKIIEKFDTKCIGPNLIPLTNVLIDNIDSNTKLDQINRISFTSSEAGYFNPIIKSIRIKDPDERIEHLKQSIMQNYILNCSNKKYTSTSQLIDIQYLNSTNKDIQAILNKKDMAHSKIIGIATILQNNVHI